MNELLDNQGRLAQDKVEELRRLKQKRAKWREERAEEDREYLDRARLLQHPLPSSQEGRYYKKSRELEVRQQVNNEQRQNALSQLQTSNETLASLRKELSEKIQDVEEARIRLALGVAPKHDSACADDTQVIDSIKGVDDTFGAIEERIKETASKNCIDLNLNILKEEVSPADKDIEPKVTKPKGSHWKKLSTPRNVAAKSSETNLALTEEERQMKDEKRRGSPSQRASEVGDDLKSIRRSYLQRGGRDADVLARMADMENNVSTLSQGDGRAGDADLRAVTDQLASIQRENAKITAQLLELKGYNQGHTKSTDVGLASPHLAPQQREYERQWEELREDLTLLQEQVALQRAHRQFDHAVRNDRPPQHLEKTSDTRLEPASTTRLDPLQQVPYDPKSGFVIFYDAVVGLDAAVEMCGLAASLYTEQREFGQPGRVPTVLCQEAPPGTDRSQVAILGTRQPVPRCWPAYDMSLVMELQVGVSDVEPSPRDPNSAVPSPSHVTQLSAQAWCKLDVFDTDLCLRSGWWRLPLRLLPVRPAEQDILPQYGRAELLVRLVNQRDSAAQSNIPLNLGELLPMYRRPDVGGGAKDLLNVKVLLRDRKHSAGHRRG